MDGATPLAIRIHLVREKCDWMCARLQMSFNSTFTLENPVYPQRKCAFADRRRKLTANDHALSQLRHFYASSIPILSAFFD